MRPDSALRFTAGAVFLLSAAFLSGCGHDDQVSQTTTTERTTTMTPRPATTTTTVTTRKTTD